MSLDRSLARSGRALLDDPELALYIRHLKIKFYNARGSKSTLPDLVHWGELIGIALDATDTGDCYVFQ